MLRSANNVFSVILDDETKNALAFAAGTLVTDANLPKGAIAVVDLGNRFLTAAAYTALAPSAQVRIVQGKGVGKPMMKTPVLTKGTLAITTSAHKAALQQITAVGYNGTTGSLPVSNDTAFYIKLRKNDNDAANRSQPMPLFAGPVKTDANGTQEELAIALAISGTKNFADEPATNYVKFEVINDEAGVVPTGTTTTFTTVVGSKVVAINGTLTNVAVGDSIRLEGTTTSSAIYVVTAYTASTSITLDRAFTGTAGVYAIANTRIITAAAAALAEYGVIVTGIAAPFDVNKFRNYYANRFTISFSDEDTIITHLQGARNGSGVWQQVAMDEYMSYGFEGQNEMLATPPTLRDQEVKIPGIGVETSLTSKYSTINIHWTESIQGLVTVAGGEGNVLLYVNLDSSGNLGGAGSTGEEVAVVLGLTAANLDE